MDTAYHRLARTRRYRWWKPLVELVLVVVLVFVLAVAAALFALAGFEQDGAAGLVTLGLSIAIALPVTLLAARATGRPWRGLLSVDHRIRGRWLATCLPIAFAQVVTSVGIAFAFEALGHPLDAASGAWIGWRAFAPLAVVVVLAIAPQAAAEEFLFRGTLLQALGAWVRPPWFAIVVSSLVFGLLHDLPLPGFISVTAVGLVAAWLTVRTGGLEAAIALHVVNNVSYFMWEAAAGRADRWVTEMNVQVSWSAALVTVTLSALYGLVVARLHVKQFPAARELAVEPPRLPAEVPAATDDLPAQGSC